MVPGTNAKTNRNAYETIHRDTIFTNVALTADNEPWWEGLPEGKPAFDWQGRPYDPANGPAAHPNSRFTVAAKNNPVYSKLADAAGGVPISAIVFGGRRRSLAPLVYQARDWLHGVLVGAGVASETTAAATGAVGVVRRDPMAMKPFAGYNFGDYWGHWINVGAKLKSPPPIFHVNWFRQDAAGKFLWPGFSDNLRVMRWIIDRCKGAAPAHDTAIGYLPRAADLGHARAGGGARSARGTARRVAAAVARRIRGNRRLSGGIRRAAAAGARERTQRRHRAGRRPLTRRAHSSQT